jgi:hypothetical protein
MTISSTIYDFSNRYRGRAQESQRSAGPSPNLPTLSDIDEVLEQSKRTVETLLHIREVTAMQQSAADHRVHDSSYKSSAEYDMEDSGIYHDDVKTNGLMGPDPKKRRGVSLQIASW